MRDAIVVAASGLSVGALFGAAFARALGSLQYGVTPLDPVSWTLVFGMIVVTTAGAAWVPARVAATSNPLVLLREE
jgi:ABC-type antimicrobial peptide transport system permease subunit